MNKFHFIGIGGIGLSGLARFLHKEGYIVSGSDMDETHITKSLRDEGIKVSVPHSSKNITCQDCVIYSAVIKEDNIEYQKAKELGLKLLSRKEALKIILKNKKVFAISGAHGKSTTSAMLASLIEGSMIIGAENIQYGSNMRYVENNNLIFEADESDESFLNTNPYLAIVTNCEPEHMEHYNHDLKRFYGAYQKFLEISKIRVINAEDAFLDSLDLEAVRLYPSKDIKNIKSILIDNTPWVSFSLKNYGEFQVRGIGEHIALDASLVILASLEIGLDIEEIKNKIKQYNGIKKRFDILFKDKKEALIDDYGHHPTEIKATLQSAKQYAKLMGYKTIKVIWQPHKYSRVLDNIDSFKTCFEGIDELVILPVWSAGEEKVNIDFKELLKKYKPKFIDRVERENKNIKLIQNEKCVDIWNKGVILGFSAGDLTYQLRGSK